MISGAGVCYYCLSEFCLLLPLRLSLFFCVCFILSAVIAVVFMPITTLFLFPKCDINFHEFMFTSLDEVTFDMGSTLKEKAFAPKGANSFYYELTWGPLLKQSICS